MASYLHRTATTEYPCWVRTLEEFSGAGRVGLAECKGTKKIETNNNISIFFCNFTQIYLDSFSSEKKNNVNH